MQIHEITFGPKKLNEGLLDTVKSGIKSAATGAARAVAPMVYGDKLKPNWMTSDKPALAQAEKLRQQINAKYGVNVQGSKPKTVPPTAATGAPPVVSYKFKPPATPGAAAQAGALPANNTNQILPRPGYLLRVVNPSNKGIYFKDPNGIWYAPSQARGMPPQKITSQKSIDYLNNLADNGAAKEIKNQIGKGI